jgi:hypothetical protein
MVFSRKSFLKPRSEIREDLSGETYTQRVVKKKKTAGGRSDEIAKKVAELVEGIVALEGYTMDTYPTDLVGADSRNLLFEGILISGYQAGQAVKVAVPNKFGVAVGYKFRWVGDTPLNYVYSVALDAKANKDSIMGMTVDTMDVRQAKKGDVFYVTRPGMAIILHQPRISGKCSPGIMLDKGDFPETTEEYMSLIYKNVSVPYLRHNAPKGKGVKGDDKSTMFAPRQKPVKDYPIYIAERDGLLDSEERVNIPVKAEFEEQFGVCRSKAKRKKSTKTATRQKVDKLARQNILMNQIYLEDR